MSTKLTKDDIRGSWEELKDYLGVKDNQADRSIMDMMFEFYTDFIDMDDPSEMIDAINKDEQFITSHILRPYKSKLETGYEPDSKEDFFTKLDSTWFKGSRKLNESEMVYQQLFESTSPLDKWHEYLDKLSGVLKPFEVATRIKLRNYLDGESGEDQICQVYVEDKDTFLPLLTKGNILRNTQLFENTIKAITKLTKKYGYSFTFDPFKNPSSLQIKNSYCICIIIGPELS